MISPSYALKEIRKNWSNTEWWKNRLIQHIVARYYRRVNKNEGTYVVDEDWDNLIILDACRYDIFKEVTGINTDYRISCGSDTVEFLIKNFTDRKLMDTVVVTATPHVDKLVKNSFYRVIPVWDKGWNDDLNIVLPETVVEYALRAEKEYPDKRLIIWFVQPHAPFLNDYDLLSEDFRSLREHIKGRNPVEVINPWEKARKGEVSIDRVWRGYKKNLEIVVSHAFKLAEKLNGKTVITSDHGNAFKRLIFPIPIKIAGHPGGVHIPELVKVPWMVLDDKERKRVRPADEKDRIKTHAKNIRLNKL